MTGALPIGPSPGPTMSNKPPPFAEELGSAVLPESGAPGAGDATRRQTHKISPARQRENEDSTGSSRGSGA